MKKGNLPYILTIAIALRLLSLNQSFWLDEATSGLVVRDYWLKDIIPVFSVNDFHPPLYYFLLEVWSSTVGTGTVALRLPSVLFGVLSVFVVYLIGKLLKDELFGSISALLLATAPLHVYYSQEARMYSMAAFFVCLACYYYLRSFGKKTDAGKAIYWFGFSACLSLIFLTDYLAVLIVPVFWVYAIIKKQNYLWWRNFALSHIPLFFSVVSIWPLFSRQYTGGIGVQEAQPGWWNILGTFSLKNVLLIPVKFTIGRVSYDSNLVYAIVLCAVFSVFGYLAFHALVKRGKRKKLSIGFEAYWLIVPIAISIALSLFVPVLTYFRFLFLLPALYLLISRGLTNLDEKLFLPLLLLAFLVNFFFTGTYLTQRRFQREDWRGAVSFIDLESEQKASQTVFAANSQMEGYRFYAKEEKFGGADTFTGREEIVWLVRYVQPIFDPNDSTRSMVESDGYVKVSEHDFNGVVVWRYERP